MSNQGNSGRMDNATEQWTQPRRDREDDARRRRDSRSREKLPADTPNLQFMPAQRSMSRSPLPVEHTYYSSPVPKNSNARERQEKNSPPVFDPAFSNQTQKAREGYVTPSNQFSKKRRSTISTPAQTNRPHIDLTSPLLPATTERPLKSSLKSPPHYYKAQDTFLASPSHSSAGYFRSQDQEPQHDAQRPSPKVFFRENMPKEHDGMQIVLDSEAKEAHYSSHSRAGRNTSASQRIERIVKRKDSPQLPPRVPKKNRPPSDSKYHSSGVEKERYAHQAMGHASMDHPHPTVSPLDPWYRSFASPPHKENEITSSPTVTMPTYTETITGDNFEAPNYNSRSLRTRPRSFTTHAAGRNSVAAHESPSDNLRVNTYGEPSPRKVTGGDAGEYRQRPTPVQVEQKPNEARRSSRSVLPRRQGTRARYEGTVQTPQVPASSSPSGNSDLQVDEVGKARFRAPVQHPTGPHINSKRPVSPVNFQPDEGLERYESISQHHTRNDDSMTYVAVTASGSSPSYELDEPGGLSEASDYANHRPTTTYGGWNSENEKISEAVERRNALLTGLGLGLTHLPADRIHEPRSIEPIKPPEEYRSPATEQHTLLDEDERATPKDLREQRHQSRVHLDRYDEMRSIEDSWRPSRHHSPSGVETKTRKPEDNTLDLKSMDAKRPQTLDDDHLGREFDDHPGELITNQFRRKSFRNDARRNTWVYDEKKGNSHIPLSVQEASGPNPGRKDSISTVWSDNDSMDEPLSENAQRMLVQLEEADSSIHSKQERNSSDSVAENGSTRHPEAPTSLAEDISGAPETIHPVRDTGVKTWRNTISPSAYQALQERYGHLEMKRQDVIFELCETEGEFIKSLKTMQRLFIDPLRARGNWVEELPRLVCKTFESLMQISDVHSKVLSALNSSRSSQYPLMLQFAEAFRPFVHHLEVHQAYLVYLEETTRHVDRLVQDETNPLGRFLKRQSEYEECGRMGLSSFLLKPMQRLTKYPLFFKQIWELTPRDHVDNLPTFSLYQSMDTMIRVMQEVKIREEEYRYIATLESRIIGLPSAFKLAHPERRLIAQGLLRRISLTEKELQRLGEARANATTSISGLQSPTLLETTPTISDLAKLGPITSPLFQSHHNRTPISLGPPSPYSPRQSFMSAVSRASSAVSDASQFSEWLTPYSPTASLALPAEFDPAGRPPSSTSSILSSGSTPYGQRSPLETSRGPTGSAKNSRSKSAQETPLYTFVFEDLLVFTSQTEKHGFLASATSQTSEERMNLVDGIGVGRILGVTDQSKKLDFEHLLQIDIIPLSFGDGRSEQATLTPTSIFLSLPVITTSHLGSQNAIQVKEAQGKWLAAFNRGYSHTLRALSFPIFPSIGGEDAEASITKTVSSTLFSGDLLPKRPLQSILVDEGGEDSEVWTRKLRRTLEEYQGNQLAPVMLIGDVALTMGKGLKRVHTTNRVKRNGPQQLLLSTASLLSSPSGGSSGSNQGQKGSLGIRRRERM